MVSPLCLHVILIYMKNLVMVHVHVLCINLHANHMLSIRLHCKYCVVHSSAACLSWCVGITSELEYECERHMINSLLFVE